MLCLSLGSHSAKHVLLPLRTFTASFGQAGSYSGMRPRQRCLAARPHTVLIREELMLRNGSPP